VIKVSPDGRHAISQIAEKLMADLQNLAAGDIATLDVRAIGTEIRDDLITELESPTGSICPEKPIIVCAHTVLNIKPARSLEKLAPTECRLMAE
jgi:hypothetical protein